MATFSNYISFLFLTTLLLPLQITARDSQFFSKVTHFTNNVKETELPKNEEQQQPLTNKPEEQQPPFIPATENSYGLYGHDSQLPSSTTAAATTTTENTNSAPYTSTYKPYKTEFEDTNKYTKNKYYNNDAYNNKYYNNDANNKYYNNDAYNKKYYNNDAYEGNQNELTDTKYTEEEEGYNSMGNQKYYHNNNADHSDRYFNNENDNYDAANNRYSNNYNNNANANPNTNRYNAERQGMSDTRFLEGGKYFYDIEYEKNNPTLYEDSSYRGVNANNRYNNRGNYYGNNNGYQNQEEFEDEQNEFEP